MMAYKYWNPNNRKLDNRDDCVVRAISKVMNQSWDKTYWELCGQGYLMGDFGNANAVWDSYLRGCGFVRRVIPNYCPDCYTVRDFCHDHDVGTYILAIGNHTIASIDGSYFDSWDSGDLVPIFYYERR